ncbi:MAG: acyl-CoA dehydrogenase family protein [Deltaproteobacteria bacterium]|nr:acyl-CoA dehydrogenase family protein [Deltaproteobacteria bacterium]
MDFTISKRQRMFIKEVEKFCRKEVLPGVEEREEKEEFSLDVWKKMAQFGLTGLCLPREYGGDGANALTTVLGTEAFARASRDSSLCNSWLSHLLLCAMNINELGNDAQKAKYLPALAAGEKIGALGVTEPDAGSDATSMQTTAKRDGDVYVLNGSKTFISNGPIADIILVYATTDPTLRAKGIVSFIVEADTPGVTLGPAFKKYGIHASPTGEVFLDDVRVPVENRLTEEGAGFKAMLESLGWERLAFTHLVGLMDADLQDAVSYARERVQFGKRIGDFQFVQGLIAEMKMDLEASRLMAYHLAGKVDARENIALDAALTKTFISEAYQRCADKAVQVFGGYGAMREYAVGRSLWWSKITTIGGGTSQVQRQIIGRMVLGK